MKEKLSHREVLVAGGAMAIGIAATCMGRSVCVAKVLNHNSSQMHDLATRYFYTLEKNS